MTTKAKILIAAAAVVVLAIAAFFYFTPPVAAPVSPVGQGEESPATTTPEDTTPEDTEPTTDPVPAVPTGQTQYTLAQVALHASADDCWTVIRGNVYDLTTWISGHPGGQQAILQLCGTDGTAEFTGQHGGSAQQENILASFQVGVLAQ